MSTYDFFFVINDIVNHGVETLYDKVISG